MGATALFYFNKQTRVQQLIHKLKYKSKPQVGVLLGQMLGSQLLKSEVFKVIEVVVPVPLHPAKKQKRGYNQAAKIAEGIALAMEITYEENGMIRTKHTETQTRKTRAERVKNMRGVFTANPKSNLEGKNILLVDDVLTTGSTLESCALELLQVSNIKIWIATLAYAE
jgi:ComF family protein